MSEQYNKSLIFQYNLDENNVPFTPILRDCAIVQPSGYIQCIQTINMSKGGVEIINPSNLVEVDNETDLANGNNKYLVLPERAMIKFSKNLVGRYISFTIGGECTQYMSADNVWTGMDSNGNITATMQSMFNSVMNGINVYKSADDLKKLITSMELNIDNAGNASSTLSNSVVIANQTNTALTKTNDDAKAEDTILKATTKTASDTNTTLGNTNTTANTTNKTLNDTIVIGNTLKSDLTALDTKALETKGLLDTSKTNADASKLALDTSKDNADTSKLALDNSITSGNTLKAGLDKDITDGNTLKTGLEADITSGNTLKTNLETATTNAGTAKSGLDGSITSGNTLKSGLQTTIDNANTAKTNLQASIDASDISGMQTSITNIMNGTNDITYSGANTTNKTVIGSLNELLSYIGTVANLTTIDKLNLVNAINELNPAGKVDWFARNTAPTGYLKCNGTALSRTTYARLFNAIGTIFGSGDGSTTFNLPDLRGVVIRGWDDGRGLDTGRAFGSYQNDDFKSHCHTQSTGGNLTTVTPSGGSGIIGQSNSTETSYVGGVETRMKNVALLPCIRY